jgi:predicted O-methyltransferase YrrM
MALPKYESLQELKEYCLSLKSPIFQDGSLDFVKQLIVDKNIKNVLEIGTGIGWSSINFANYGCNVETVEKNPESVKLAREQIKKYDFTKQIKVINADYLEYEPKWKKNSFDLIFIDAAKSQYQKFFIKSIPFLAPKGVVICDNIAFHYLQYDKQSRSVKGLIRKLNEFKEYVLSLPEFKSKIIPIGDTIIVSERV